MTTPHPTRRAGLGRSVADILAGTEPSGDGGGSGGLLRGPAVVPLDVVPFAMLISDAGGRVLAVNQRWVSLSGLAPEESLGSGWLSVLRPEDRLPLRSQVQQVATGTPSLRAEYPWAPAAGRRAAWWMASHERVGERLVGIGVLAVPAARLSARQASPRVEPLSVEPLSVVPAGAVAAGAASIAGGAPASSSDPVLAELPALLESVGLLLDSLDRLVDRLPPAQAVPA